MLSRYLDRVWTLLRASGAQSVLDAGCGEGAVYRAMRGRGFTGQWTGVDLSAGAVAYAAARAPDARWEVASLDALPFRTRSFDLVLCSQVLEHIPNPDVARNSIARVAQGQLLVSVPWEPMFRCVTALSIKAGVGEDPGHVNHWNGATFREFLSSAGRVTHWERLAVYQLALVDLRAGETLLA